MSIFEKVSLKWGGKEYDIESDKVMGAIAKVEEVITLQELFNFYQKNDAPMAKLAMAFAAVLRYAGATVKDEEVYAAMFNHEDQNSVTNSINTLLVMMVPPSAMGGGGNGKAAPTGGKNSSKKPIK
jgi:hypothetical protein